MSSQGDSLTPGSRIHFGTLEQQAFLNAKRKRDEEEGEEAKGSDKGVALEDLTADDLDDEQTYDISEASAASKESQRAMLAELERRRLARTLAVPTADSDVKAKLRELGEPICLFGEDAADRRSRLRYVMSLRAVRSEEESGKLLEAGLEAEEESEEEEEGEEEEFYTEGSTELLEARKVITAYSLAKARDRLARELQINKCPLTVLKQQRLDLYNSIKTYTIFASQVCDTRPVSRVAFSPNSQVLASGTWSGLIKLWKIPHCEATMTLRGHSERVGGLSFHPQATISLDLGAANLASGGADNKIYLWSLQSDTPIASLDGHASRVVHIDHHPSGQYLGSASYDGSWRLWDIPTRKELLLQEGHCREVFALKFQDDGALAASGGLDGVACVWDLRSGRQILAMEGHAKEIYGLDWSPNGYHIATASADNTIRILDLRKRQHLYTIPAHKSVVSDVKFYHGDHRLPLEPSGSNGDGDRDMEIERGREIDGGESAPTVPGLYLASSSYDGTVKIWSADTWKLVKSLPGHEGKVMSLDISQDNQFIASSGFDRTFKLWGREDLDFGI